MTVLNLTFRFITIHLLFLINMEYTESLLRMLKNEQCNGGQPMPSVSTFLNATLDYDVANWICCNNHRYAEDKGYLASPEVDLFSRLDHNKETVFYDSVCGIPLFIAPRGRSFEEFEKESLHHGWPSFSPEEIVSENVIIHFTGRMESKCGTHLGHNLPENGEDRYCIDLVCIAGTPMERAINPKNGVLTNFNPNTYSSSAAKISGRNSTNVYMIISSCVIFFCIISFVVYYGIKRKYKSKPSMKSEHSYGTYN